LALFISHVVKLVSEALKQFRMSFLISLAHTKSQQELNEMRHDLTTESWLITREWMTPVLGIGWYWGYGWYQYGVATILGPVLLKYCECPVQLDVFENSHPTRVKYCFVLHCSGRANWFQYCKRRREVTAFC